MRSPNRSSEAFCYKYYSTSMASYIGYSTIILIVHISQDLEPAGFAVTTSTTHAVLPTELRQEPSYISADEFREADIMRSVSEFFRCSLPKRAELCFLSLLSRRAARYMASEMPADASLYFILLSKFA